MRECYDSIILRADRLTQQLVVDNYVKMLSSNLRWIALNQDTIHADLYKGLEDSYNVGEHNTCMISYNTSNGLLNSIYTSILLKAYFVHFPTYM